MQRERNGTCTERPGYSCSLPRSGTRRSGGAGRVAAVPPIFKITHSNSLGVCTPSSSIDLQLVHLHLFGTSMSSPSIEQPPTPHRLEALAGVQPFPDHPRSALAV